MAFGESLAIAIRKRGIKNTTLAKKLGVNKDSVSRWIKKGSPSLVYRHAILEYFDMSESEFALLSE